MDNINLNGLTNEQFALYCATKVVSSAVYTDKWTPDAELISYYINNIAKASLDFLNNPDCIIEPPEYYK